MSEKRPMLLVFAGPNGSGKSTITQYFGIVKKCAVREYPKSEIDRYQAAW